MRKALGAACGTAAVLVAFACSSSSHPHPPVQDGCKGAGCYGGGSGGGGSTSGSSGVTSSSGSGDASDDVSTGNCGVASNASQCMQCLARSCCTQLSGCFNNSTCETIMGCVNACSGGSVCPSQTCVTTCKNQFPAAANTYGLLFDCECGACNTDCTQLGVGDPCGGSLSSCNVNLTCNGSWCTRTCSKDADCAGVGQNGGNYLGFGNACVHATTGANACAPGCNVAQDCAGFPGTTCVVAQDIAGGNVFVCGAIGDAATE